MWRGTIQIHRKYTWDTPTLQVKAEEKVKSIKKFKQSRKGKQAMATIQCIIPVILPLLDG